MKGKRPIHLSVYGPIWILEIGTYVYSPIGAAEWKEV